jgi:hypothetical protein
MKRISEFKGYRTTTEFDLSQGTFVQVQVGWDGFEPQPSRSAEVVPFTARVKIATVKKLAAKKIQRESLV